MACNLFRSCPEALLSFYAELSHADGKQLIWRMQAESSYNTSCSPMSSTHLPSNAIYFHRFQGFLDVPGNLLLHKSSYHFIMPGQDLLALSPARLDRNLSEMKFGKQLEEPLGLKTPREIPFDFDDPGPRHCLFLQLKREID